MSFATDVYPIAFFTLRQPLWGQVYKSHWADSTTGMLKDMGIVVFCKVTPHEVMVKGSGEPTWPNWTWVAQVNVTDVTSPSVRPTQLTFLTLPDPELVEGHKFSGTLHLLSLITTREVLNYQPTRDSFEHSYMHLHPRNKGIIIDHGINQLDLLWVQYIII